MKTRAVLLGLVGLALLTALVAWKGSEEVLTSAAGAGWGVLVVALWHVVPMFVDASGWRALLDRDDRPPLVALVRHRWISESVNGLLPVAQVGGEFVRARLLMRHRVDGATAGASVLVDITLGFTMQLVFALAGVLVLAASVDEPGLARGLAAAISAGLVLMGLFFLAQRGGMFLFLARAIERTMGERVWLSFAGGAGALDERITWLWKQRGRVAWCALARLSGWVLGTGEVWLAMRFLDTPVTLEQAMVIESLAQAARSAGFAIPAAIGVQEGGYLLACQALGIPSEPALALALVRRARELIQGVPGLAAWQLAEGRRLLLRRRAQREGAALAPAPELERATAASDAAGGLGPPTDGAPGELER